MINKSHAAMFIMGSLNGFLPCGLSLIALTWCLTLRGPVDGFNFMLAFGAGTLPVMAGFTGFLPTVIQKFRLSLHKATTSMLIISGLILIIRVFIVHMPHTSTARAGMMDFILCQ
jgi:sulfite exporter TauE/SafE